jgi:hypothetical protein
MYGYISNKIYATAQAQHDAIVDLMTSCGWTPHDVQPGVSTVMKSTGPAIVYVCIYATTNTITSSCNWNATTHTNVGILNNGYTHPYGTNNALYAYCSPDFIVTITSTGGAYTSYNGAFRPTTMAEGSFTTTITSALATGTNVVIPVADNTNFNIGCYYSIFDIVNGRRCTFKCTAKASGNITANSITGPLTTGSFIGVNVYPWITGYAQNQIFSMGIQDPRCNNASGNNGIAAITKFRNYSSNTSSNLVDSFGSLVGTNPGDRRLFDLELTESNNTVPQSQNLLGTANYGKSSSIFDTTSVYQAPYTLLDFDALGSGMLDSGTSTGLNTNTTFNDTSKSWATNQFANCALVITSGGATGQIVKIESNTATQLTVSSQVVLPSSDTYTICTSAYRMIKLHGASNIFFPEGV